MSTIHNQKLSEHLDNSLAKVRNAFEKAIARIEAVTPGEKVTATGLANELGDELGLSGPSLYQVIKMFLLDGYPRVLIAKGARGGIIKLTNDDSDYAVDPVESV